MCPQALACWLLLRTGMEHPTSGTSIALAAILLCSAAGPACDGHSGVRLVGGAGGSAAGAAGDTGLGQAGSTGTGGTGGVGTSGLGGIASGGTSAGSACASSPRVPAIHRASEGPACPKDRAPGGAPASCAPDGGPPPGGTCQRDSDCTAGINGRCLELRPPSCYMVCSYDECFQDSDCAGNVPCHCRDSDSSTDSNWCLSKSNCRLDEDCGPGGYCSPSQLDNGCMRMCTVPCDSETHCYAGTTEVPCSCGESCGAGYFCHTADDACTNDCECAERSACTHQPTGGWACIPCANVP